MNSPLSSDLMARSETITKRLMAEAGLARRSWTLFEAMNGKDDDHRRQLREGINRLGLGGAVQGLVGALARDTISSLLRMSDAPGKDRQTLCRLSAHLQSPDLQAARNEAARGWMPSFGPEQADRNANAVAAAMKSIMDLVPPTWPAALVDSRLHYYRERMLPLRSTSLAHLADGSNVAQPIINEIRGFLELTSELVQHAALVFTGTSVGWDTDYDIRLREATEFWAQCEKGFLEI